jgi:site-specific DNA-methyltransferase (adenine-specific)
MKPYYEDGAVTIYHGDCREVLPLLRSGPMPLVLTDPPYGIDYQHGSRKGGVRYGMDQQRITGDDEPFDPSHLLVYPRLVIWGGNHFADRLPPSRGWLVWDKRDGTPSNDQSDAEMAWTNILSVVRVFSARWSGSHRTGREQAEGRVHVNQKPVALMRWCLTLVGGSEPVLDPYMGSGSTLVAAKDAGRPAIGIEIDEAHCETAAQRCSQEVLGLSA